jgi:hypothetical protein
VLRAGFGLAVVRLVFGERRCADGRSVSWRQGGLGARRGRLGRVRGCSGRGGGGGPVGLGAGGAVSAAGAAGGGRDRAPGRRDRDRRRRGRFGPDGALLACRCGGGRGAYPGGGGQERPSPACRRRGAGRRVRRYRGGVPVLVFPRVPKPDGGGSGRPSPRVRVGSGRLVRARSGALAAEADRQRHLAG